MTVGENVLAPSSIDEVVAIVRELHESATHFAVSSGATPASGQTIVVSVSRLTRVELREASLTLRAEAGATVASLRAAGEKAKLRPVGLPDSVTAEHVGGLIARGEVPRRSVSGIEGVLSTGEVVRTGGSVLKDVVGYDLPALLLGSMGWLAIIVAVTFRVEPAAARTPVSAPAGVTQSGYGVVRAAFDPQGLLRGRY